MSVQGLKRLQVWVRAKDFALKVYKQILPLLPPGEKWNLNQQLQRSSLSVSANIAEGYGRFYYQDNEPGANYAIREETEAYGAESLEDSTDIEATTTL